MTTIIEIVDTVVKIGLGALISGVVTYVVSTKNHAHEIKKSVSTEKKDLLLKLIQKLDSSFSRSNSAIQSIWRKQERNASDLEEDYTELTEALNELKLAISYSFLIGNEDMASLIGSMFSNLEAARHSLESRERNWEFINTQGDERTQLLNEARAMFPIALESAYA